ncbi:MAG TPA: HAD-IA family hydrolase [Ktedonobacterales bacterium]|jgi:HAD superfamily hydrolase (TIGR01509 family)
MIRGRKLRCILFDLGSTLWTRSEDKASLAESAAQVKAGAMLRRVRGNEAFSTLEDGTLGALLSQSIDKHMDKERLQHPEFEPDRVPVTMRALQEFGLANIDQARAGALFEALRVRIPDSRVLFADTLSTLEALKQRGYLLGVVTNRSYGGPLFREDVAVMGLLSCFEYAHMAISADLGVCKPHPEIFRYALNGLNVSPEEAAMVGNDLRADIAGAKRLHILSIWKASEALVAEKTRTHDEIEPDLAIERLSQLLDIV